MYSIPTQASTPFALQKKLSERMRTSANKLSSSTEMTRSSSTIGPACGTSDRISGIPMSLSPKHESCIGAAKGERIAQDPTQRMPETAPRLGHTQHRQVGVGHDIPQLRRAPHLGILNAH